MVITHKDGVSSTLLLVLGFLPVILLCYFSNADIFIAVNPWKSDHPD